MEFDFKKEITNELKKLGFKRSLGGTKANHQELEIGIDKRIDLPKDTFIKWIDDVFLLSVKIKIEDNVTLIDEEKSKIIGMDYQYKSDYSFFDLKMSIFDLKSEIDYRAQKGYPVNIRHLFMTTIFYQSLSELSGEILNDTMTQINNRTSNTDERTKEIFEEIIADFKALVYKPLFENTDENFSFYDYYVYFTRYEKYDKKFCAINFNYDLIKIASREKRYK